MSHLFYMQHRVGDLVDVAPVTRRGRPNSEGGRGYIKRSSSPTSVESFDVEYILTKKLSKNVDPERLSPAIIEPVARRRRPRSAADADVPIQPSLLSIHHQAAQKLRSTVTPSPPKRPKTTSNLVTTDALLERFRIWQSQSKESRGIHPILDYLQRNNNKKDPGYLRRNDAKAAGIAIKSHCSPEEKNRILRIKAQLSGFVDFKVHGVTGLIAHAYGIGKRTLQDWEKKGTDQSRKQRSDAGGNVLTSSKLQDNWFSAYNCWKKSQRRSESRIANTLLDTDANDSDESNLKEQWDSLLQHCHCSFK